MMTMREFVQLRLFIEPEKTAREILELPWLEQATWLSNEEKDRYCNILETILMSQPSESFSLVCVEFLCELVERAASRSSST